MTNPLPQLPFRLAEGIWFQDANDLVPWDTPIDDLRAFRSPHIVEHPTSVHLTWTDRVCLGFSCNVSACRIFEEINPRAYLLYLDTFHRASLRWRGPSGLSREEISQSYKAAYEQLRQSLGEASFSYPAHEAGGWTSMPWIFWEWPSMMIGLHGESPRQPTDPERHPDPLSYDATQFTLFVEHEPPGYEAVKATARRIRECEGEGARVDFVAW